MPNNNGVGNRPPLQPSRFLPLPSGSVVPRGWLMEILRRQRDGLNGQLGGISAWLQKDGNAWLDKNGQGEYGWEEVPYWLKGYMELAFLFEDPEMISECRIWIEGVLASQRPDGDFGPDQRFEDDGTRDYWANMVMLFCLQTWHERTGDERVIVLMTRYFQHQLTLPENEFLTHYWQHLRGGDNLLSVIWLYNQTGHPWLLELGAKIHRCTANWKMPGDLPNWHNVNIAQGFREPAEHYLLSGDPRDLEAAYANFHEVRQRYGQVPGGMWGGDENSRPGHDDPHQAIETCGVVEQMFSDAWMLQATGDSFWGDHCEEVAFNTYPAALTPDMRSLRYLLAPNMVVSDAASHAPEIENGGPYFVMNPLSSRCCQHNHSHGWPYFAKHLWMATPDDGLVAAVHCASEVTARLGQGTTVRIESETRYPFEDTIRYTVHVERPTEFPLYLRLPAWCESPSVSINEGPPQKLDPQDGSYALLRRKWREGDHVLFHLPMVPIVRRWQKNHHSASVHYGPLTFSLKIGERHVCRDSAETALWDSQWQESVDRKEWPAWEIFPETSWNYGLAEALTGTFSVIRRPWPADDYPFTPESSPLILQARARRIPEWTLDRHGLCAELQDSPVRSEEPEQTIQLIPMGAARLRISQFPVIGTGPEARRWTLPEHNATTAGEGSPHRGFARDFAKERQDGTTPKSSSDTSIPHEIWNTQRGGMGRLLFRFKTPRGLDRVRVYWFDNTGTGECRVPQTWRVLYKARDGDNWRPVPGGEKQGAVKDGWDELRFPALTASALCVEAMLQPDHFGGVFGWQVPPIAAE